MSVVRTDGRAGGRSVYGHVITKFSRMGSLPHFFTHGAPLRASRARAPLLKIELQKVTLIHLQEWKQRTGLSLRGGGQRFPPATMDMAPGYVQRKIEEK